jgi:hypothetical protein
MSKEEDNKATVGRWFTDFWGKTCNLGILISRQDARTRQESTEGSSRASFQTARVRTSNVSTNAR